MIFRPTPLAGAFVIEPQPHADERGFFARTFCAREFAEHGLVTGFDQNSVSFNKARGTVRGLHFQEAPDEEVKLVRCTAGSILDVIVDIRPDSATHLQHFQVELSGGNRLALYVPKGFAHGFQTLENGAEVAYQIHGFHSPEKAGGLRFDDPVLKISWPLPVAVISQRDRSWPALNLKGAISLNHR
jgi:dTDP-4-dehydrorhamnose 3,5-epimerase